MLCAASPGIGKQFHQWIPHIRERVTKLRETPKPKEVKEYFKKIYPSCGDDDITLLCNTFIDNHQKKMYLASKFPNIKYDEIEILSEIVTEEEIQQYEKDWGN